MSPTNLWVKGMFPDPGANGSSGTFRMGGLEESPQVVIGNMTLKGKGNVGPVLSFLLLPSHEVNGFALPWHSPPQCAALPKT
jgi:hypothetical protein